MLLILRKLLLFIVSSSYVLLRPAVLSEARGWEILDNTKES